MRSTAWPAGRAWRALPALALAAVAALAGGTPAHAHGGQGSLSVTAVVPRHTSIRIAQPPGFTVSGRDLARGFVEIAAPVEVLVQSNAAEGYALVFARHGDAVGEVRVQGLGEPLVFAAEGAIAPRPAAGRGLWREQLLLRFRFTLAAHTQAGEHHWPVQISLMNQ